MVDLHSSIRASFNERLIIDMIITSLSQHEELKGIHTIIRSKHSEQPDLVTNIEEQVTSVLHDVRAEVAPAANSNEDVVASIGADQRFEGNLIANSQRQQSLPETTQQFSAAVWATMSQEARDRIRQENKESQGRQ